MNPTQLDPCADGIRPHFCIRHIPEWPDNSARMMALRRELQTTGLCPPIQMTAKHEIVDPDSRDRWRAARMLQLTSIPVAFIADGEESNACASTLAHRRHLTKSALAYLIFPLVEPMLKQARARAIKMLQKGNDLPSGFETPTAKSVVEIAAQYGIENTLFKDAKKVHAIFAADPQFKAQMEPRILQEAIGGEHEQNRPVGLGAVIAGYEGKQLEDTSRADRSQLELFGRAVKAFSFRSRGLDEAAARKAVRAEFEKLSDPGELEGVLQTALLLSSEAKARLKQISQVPTGGTQQGKTP